MSECTEFLFVNCVEISITFYALGSSKPEANYP